MESSRASSSESDRELNKALQKNLEQQERIRILEAQLLQANLKDRLGHIEALTVNDKSNLLALLPAVSA